MDNKKRLEKIIKLLEKEYSDAKIALHYVDPLELLVATILSAQCTDEKVNQVTKTLFRKYRKVEDYANANLKKLEQEIRPTGFYHNKAKTLKKMGQTLVEKFNSQVPETMEDLLTIPGVGRKTANIVLANAFGLVEGIAVDTHVRRLTKRLGLTRNENADKIEEDLMKIVPKTRWKDFSDMLIFHGRRVCTARKPNCGGCVVNKLCPSAFIFG